MNAELIEQIAGWMFPEDMHHLWGDVNTREREAVANAFTAIEPFIPKWEKVSDGNLPEPGEKVLCRWPKESGMADTLDELITKDGHRRIWVTEFMRIPSTTHPFEELLNSLKDGKQPH